MAAAKKQKKVSDARAKAQAALTNAKSDQEKRVARQALNLVKFREVAPPRVSRALAALDNVAKLANRKAYAWEQAHSEKITKAITDAAAKIAAGFAAPSEGPAKPTFTL